MFKLLKNNRGEVGPTPPAPPAPPAPPPAPLAGNWTTTLEQGDQDFTKLKGWEAPQDVIKSYRELEKFSGYDKIAAPKKGADGNYETGEIQRVMGALGAPKDAAGYQVNEYKLPEGREINAEWLNGVKERAVAEGMLPGQMNFMMKEVTDLINQGSEMAAEAQKKAFGEQTVALRTKWGFAYDQNKSMVDKLIDNYGEENAAAIAEKYGNDPLIIELVSNIGKDMSEESLEHTNIRGTALTPEAAKQEIATIRHDMSHAFNKAEHPEHDYWVERMFELNKMAAAGQA